jgi:PDZ domain-containing secreted protein
MRKTIILAAVIMFISCNNSANTYTKCIETSYNLNKETIDKVISINKTDGGFTVEILNNTIKIVDKNGKETLLNDDNGYSVTNKMIGDTLVIGYLPTENTPSNVLKYGSEYKFYN